VHGKPFAVQACLLILAMSRKMVDFFKLGFGEMFGLETNDRRATPYR
jgi:hypothetical protein